MKNIKVEYMVLLCIVDELIMKGFGTKLRCTMIYVFCNLIFEILIRIIYVLLYKRENIHSINCNACHFNIHKKTLSIKHFSLFMIKGIYIE